MIRGTSYDQDGRFPDKHKQVLELSTWPDKYAIKIDLQKVDMPLIRLWIDKTVLKRLGHTDDIASGTAVCLLDQCLEKGELADARKIHVALSGLLHSHTLDFMSELWTLLDSAQKSSGGIPQSLIEEQSEKERQERKRLAQIKAKSEELLSRKFRQVRESSRRHEEKRKQRRRSASSESPKRKSRRRRDRSRQKRHRKQKEASEASSDVVSGSDS